jgi:hypothetical protein
MGPKAFLALGATPALVPHDTYALRLEINVCICLSLLSSSGCPLAALTIYIGTRHSRI